MSKKHTKIIATISDKMCSKEFLENLYEAGMDAVRLNTAHQTQKQSLKVMQVVRSVSDKIPIIVDTKGPEIRTTVTRTDIEVTTGQKITVSGKPDKESTPEHLYTSYEGIVDDVPVGTSILIDDGSVELKVIDKTATQLVCEVANDGVIKSRKSINIPGAHINLPALSDKDRRFVQFAIEHDVDFIAHSFVRNKADLQAIQAILDQHNSKVKLIAKIENQQGVDNIDEILEHAYGIMVARGDLGIEIAAEKIPGIQKHLINKCIQRKRPVIIATQMLHSMISNPRPTRAEVTDVANAIYHEADAIMLSGETAYGEYAEEAVKTMSRIAKEVESSREVQFNRQIISIDNQIAILLAESAANAALELPVKGIVLDTLTGRTARYLAAFRGRTTGIAVAYSRRVMRELALSYGIYANYCEKRSTTNEFKKALVKYMLQLSHFEKEDLICVIGGSFGPRNGASFLEINTIENLLSEIQEQ